ncbi:hypothetical protein [Bdellovibrio sp. BCCA]|uniref:hypothetical protein n=1 Tax=Bdellovibrio sp. BCCA TaxID=3136281 RepID=UPI0030F0B60A
MDNQNEMSQKIWDQLKDVVERPGPSDDLSRAMGQFLFYQNRIEILMERLILSLCPQVKHYMESKNKMNFSEKLLLLESVTADFDKIPLFKLLKELNTVRNKLAHKEFSDDMFDSEKLLKLVQASFPMGPPELARVGNAGKITIAVKASAVTNIYLECIVNTERFGREEDAEFKFKDELAETYRNALEKRLRNLIMKFQTRLKEPELGEYQKKLGMTP